MEIAFARHPMRDHGPIGMGAVAWLIGVAALVCDYLQASRPLILGMHTLFGMVVGATICLALIPKACSLRQASRAELYLFTRSVSHWVYIFMYALAIVRVGLNFYEASQPCSLCAAHSGAGSIRSMDDFQFYIACCVVPLWVVRAIVLMVPFPPIRAPSP
jgi:hypothetical protein